jgi:hypothetical protein
MVNRNSRLSFGQSKHGFRSSDKEDFLQHWSRFVPQKRIDLIVKAFCARRIQNSC